MLSVKKISKVSFDESVNNFDSKDGIISIVYYFYEMIILYLFGIVMFKTNIYRNGADYLSINNSQLYKLIFYVPIVILQVLPVFIIIKMRGQSVKSTGLKTDRILKSILLGILFSLPFVMLSLINAILQGKGIMTLADLIWMFLYFFIEIAFAEELSFRGFIQTRIQGLIKTKWISIMVVGIMFSLMHIPFQMIKASMPLGQFIINDSIHLAITFVIHVYFVYLYTRDNNIVSSTVAHGLIDFIPTMFI